MEMSEKLGDLFSAMAKMQGALSMAGKAKQAHGYKYADLAECIHTAKPALEANDLAVTQMMGMSAQGTTLITMLIHSSGQWLRSEFVMEKAVLQGGGGKNPAQILGSGITYMRRYAYAAIIGLAQTDDDAKLLDNSIPAKQVINKITVEQLQAHILKHNQTVEVICSGYNVGSLAEIADKQLVIDETPKWEGK